MSQNPIPAILKELPHGRAFCCGFLNPKGASCKGILATCHVQSDGAIQSTDAPLGFALSQGVWRRSHRSASRFTSEAKAGRQALQSMKNGSGSRDSEVEAEMKAWARSRVQTSAEPIRQFPAKIECPACKRIGIIDNVDSEK